MTRQQLYADLPPDLQEADDILRRYGRWARGGANPGRCGSAERNYRAPQDDEDRQPAEPTMPGADVERVRRSLASLPMMTLCVIQWLYVRPSAVAALTRKNGIQPRHLRERHLDGVRLFWANWQRLEPATTRPVALASHFVENVGT